MVRKENDPGALAGADRVGVIVLDGKNDATTNTPTACDLQVIRLCRRFLVSVPMARAIAEIAFFSGRKP